MPIPLLSFNHGMMAYSTIYTALTVMDLLTQYVTGILTPALPKVTVSNMNFLSDMKF
jgi:hypothetical protein